MKPQQFDFSYGDLNLISDYVRKLFCSSLLLGDQTTQENKSQVNYLHKKNYIIYIQFTVTV